MRARRFHLYMLATLCMLVIPSAIACTYGQMNHEEAQSQTDGTVIARVLRVVAVDETRFSRSFRYTVEILGSERGVFKTHAILEVEYVIYKATNIDGKVRCPLNSGSGIEAQLDAGSSYRLLVSKGAGSLALYWAERWMPAANAQTSGE